MHHDTAWILLPALVGCSAAPPWADVDCEPIAACNDQGCTLIIDADLARVRVTTNVGLDPTGRPDTPVGWLVFSDPATGSVVSVMWADAGVAEQDIELPVGTYDVSYQLDNSGGQRGFRGSFPVATGIDLEPGSVLDVQVPAVTISGTIAGSSDVSTVLVRWRASQGTAQAFAPTTDGTYSLQVPAVPGALLLSGAQAHGRIIYEGDPVAAVDSSADIELDLELDVVEVGGPVTIDGSAPSEAMAVWLRPAKSPSYPAVLPVEDGTYRLLMTPGRIELGLVGGEGGAWSPALVADLEIEDDTELPLTATRHRVALAEGSEPTASALFLQHPGDANRHFGSATSGAVARPFTGRYDVVATPQRYAAPGTITVATDLDVQDDIELPSLPEVIGLEGRWGLLPVPGWQDRGGHALSFVSDRNPDAERTQTPTATETFTVDVFEGDYEVWASMIADSPNSAENQGLTVHQKIRSLVELDRASTLDVELDWVEFVVEVQIDGQTIRDRPWRGEVVLTHHDRPALQTTLGLEAGVSPTLAVPAGVYDVSWRNAEFWEVAGTDCVLIE